LAAAFTTAAAYRSSPAASLDGWSIALAIGAMMVGGIAFTHWKMPFLAK